MSLPIRPDQPQTGYYKMRRVRGGVFVPVKLWHGAPLDPEDYSATLDRSHRWQALVDGELWDGDVLNVWIRCAGRQIPESEYRYMVATAAHYRKHGVDHPTANPGEPVDFMRSPLVF